MPLLPTLPMTRPYPPERADHPGARTHVSRARARPKATVLPHDPLAKRMGSAASHEYDPGDERDAVASPSRARPALDDAHVRRPFDGCEVQRAVPRQPREGPDRALRRLRPADAD